MIFCTKCGKQLDDDALFCSKCGTPVKQETKEQPAEVSVPVDQPQYQSVPYSAEQWTHPQVIVQNNPQAAPQPTRQTTISEEAANSLSVTALIMGILSLVFFSIVTMGFMIYELLADSLRAITQSTLLQGVFSLIICTSGVLSFIFGVIARSKSNTLVAGGYPLTGKARTGRIMGTICFIFGIVFGSIITISCFVFFIRFALLR